MQTYMDVLFAVIGFIVGLSCGVFTRPKVEVSEGPVPPPHSGNVRGPGKITQMRPGGFHYIQPKPKTPSQIEKEALGLLAWAAARGNDRALYFMAGYGKFRRREELERARVAKLNRGRK